MFPRLFFILLFIPSLSAAQDARAQANDTQQDWRDTSGYSFPSLASTVAAAQNMAHAMILRDYCANRKLADDFVRNRLERFSRMTGRQETCQSLLEYEHLGTPQTRPGS